MPFQSGHRKLGGRVRGTKNKATQAVREAQVRLQRLLGEEIPFTPLQVMRTVMLLKVEKGDLDGALLAAEKAAPYSHARLNATDVRVQVNQRSDAELAAEIEALRQRIERSRPPLMLFEAKAEPAEAAHDESTDEDERAA